MITSVHVSLPGRRQQPSVCDKFYNMTDSDLGLSAARLANYTVCPEAERSTVTMKLLCSQSFIDTSHSSNTSKRVTANELKAMKSSLESCAAEMTKAIGRQLSAALAARARVCETC